MNYEEQLAHLEKQKQAILKKNEKETSGYYYCFVSNESVGFYSPKLPKGVMRYGSHLSFEIIAVPEKNASELYCIEFNTTIELEKEKIVWRHSSSSSIKSVNKQGLLLINNYDDLTEKKRLSLIEKLTQYYDSLEDPDDSLAVPRLDMRHLVDYIKVSNNLSLMDLTQLVTERIDDIIETYLSKIMVEKTTTGGQDVQKDYYLAQKDKKALIKDIKNNFYPYVENTLCLQKENDPFQNHWIKQRNQVATYFNEKFNHWTRLSFFYS